MKYPEWMGNMKGYRLFKPSAESLMKGIKGAEYSKKLTPPYYRIWISTELLSIGEYVLGGIIFRRPITSKPGKKKGGEK